MIKELSESLAVRNAWPVITQMYLVDALGGA
jgi:hypothetical protein